MDSQGEMPAPTDSMEEKLLFLQENLSNFVKQYSLPIIESALVISKYINILLDELEKKAFSENEVLPLEITEPRAISGESQTPKIEDFPLDKLKKCKTIGISSGASAPEILVEEFVDKIKKEFTVEIEEVEIVKENVTFKIPGKLN